jgi:hypothetical protein
MRARSISEQQVIIALATPDRRYRGSRGNMIAEKRFGSATLCLVYKVRIDASQTPSTFVITATWK